MSHLSISLLGPFQVTRDGEPVAGFESDTARALLTYLVLRADTPCPREVLAGLLWPEQPNSEALRNLRVALSRLRDATGDREADPPFLHITRKTLQFNVKSDHWLDVRVLNDAVATSKAHAHRGLERCTSCMDTLGKAASLYRGDFLAGFSLDSAPFEEWLVVQRESLHLQALDVLHHLALYSEGRGENDQALRYARRQVELEPWRESAHRQWMRALAASGQRGMAMAQYEACCQVLAEELGVEPEAETARLYEQIRTGAWAPPARPPVEGAAAEPQVEAMPPPTVVPAPEEAPLPRPPSLEQGVPEGERRIITVVQADVSRPTALTSRLDGEEWAAFVGQFLRAAGAEVHRLEGEVDRYDPEGLVALFGARTAHEDDPERAVLAALAMQTAFRAQLAQLAQWAEGEIGWEPSQGPGLRVGVHTGEAIVALVEGEGGRGRRALMGDALSSANRVLALVPPGEVRVSEGTRRLVEPLFEWGPGESSHAPLRHKALAGKGRGIEGLESPLVGRDAEFHALQEAVARLREGIGGIVTIVGEAGIGKSRLVAEIRTSINLKSPNLKWIEGRCLSYATNVAYQPWLDVVRGLLGLAAEAAPGAAVDALRERVRALCPDDAHNVYPFLAQMLSLPLTGEAEERLRGLDAEGLRVLTFRAVQTLVECAARREPLVLVCEDLHWADPTSLALLEQILPLTDRVPLLVLCVFRPEKEHGCWRIKESADRLYGHRHTDLWLDPLIERESAELLGHLLHVEDLPETLRAHILGHAEGNPFYVEEILRSLIDAAADGGAGIAYDETTGRWGATHEIADIPLPATLRGVLMARFDRLPASARQILQLAAVVGRIFERRVLESISQRARDLDEDLVTLQRGQMIRQRAQLPETAYIFKHQLTQEAAYESLLRRKRRALHRRVAETLERLYPERGSPFRGEGQLGLLAFHWEEGGETSRAAGYLERAGAQAASQFANQEALSYLTRALALTPDGDLLGRYRLLLTREAVYHLQGTRSSQRADLLALRDLARALDDGGREAARRQAEVALREAKYLFRTGNWESAAASAEEAVRLAQVAQDRALEAAGHLLRGEIGLGSDEATVAELEHALALARAAHDRTLEAESLRELGLHFSNRGENARAMPYHEQTLRLYREIGNRMGEGRALNALGWIYQDRYDLARARRYTEQGLRLCRETGNRHDEAWGLCQLGGVCFHEGDYPRAMARLGQALRIMREIGAQRTEMIMLLYTGIVHRCLGNYERALELYERVLRSPYAEGGTQAWAMALKGRLLHETGDDPQARACCERALSMWGEGHQYVRAQTSIYLGHALASLGHLAEAQEVYRASASRLRQLGRVHHSIAAVSGLADVALAGGRQVQALVYAEQVLSYLDAHPALDAMGELFRLYLICYRVLRANEDPRAGEVLSRAYALLQEWAAKIEDQDLHRSFLDNVTAHREIVALWEEASHP